jgi:arylsulfatase A-like enzyme
MTGRYQQRFGHEFNPPGDRAGLGLPLTETTIADRLKAAGYATGLVGKWHLGGAAEYHPLRRGFDEFFGFLGGAHPYLPGPEARINRGTRIVDEKQYLTDAIAREAASFVDRHKAHPFFLYVSFNAVHTPMQADDGRLKRFASIADETRRSYAAMLAAMDEGIGRVIDALRANGLEENTLIVFLSDNGGPTLPGTTVNGSRNQPLRGSKRTTLEGGVRVPFVMQWTGKLPAGAVYEPPVIQLDLLPTALAAAGVSAEPGWKLDGVDLLPYLRGKVAEAPHDSLYWRLGPQIAIRRGAWKLVRYDRTVDQAGARSNPRSTEVTAGRLYNLDLDPGEESDLSARHPEKAAELLRAWQSWNAQLAAPLWGPG